MIKSGTRGSIIQRVMDETCEATHPWCQAQPAPPPFLSGRAIFRGVLKQTHTKREKQRPPPPLLEKKGGRGSTEGGKGAGQKEKSGQTERCSNSLNLTLHDPLTRVRLAWL